jgi:ferredoxin-NADP reductase
MGAAPAPVATGWQPATVTAIRPETATATTISLRPAAPFDHVPGQHVVVRLTAPDGYRASRSYSIASLTVPDGTLDITVERLPDGEVSTFLCDELLVDDEIEVRGPIGTYFVWRGEEPAVLVGGGSGLVPLMCMLRLARRGTAAPARLVASVRTPADLYYAAELPGPDVRVVHTRIAPPGASRRPQRLAPADLAPIVVPGATAFVCGSNGFADHAAALLMDAGFAAGSIRVERFGATG